MVKNFKSGLWNYYYKNGKIKGSGNFLDGLEHGEWKFYNKLGKLEKKETFTKKLKNLLEFKLTGDQKKAIDEISLDLPLFTSWASDKSNKLVITLRPLALQNNLYYL